MNPENQTEPSLVVRLREIKMIKEFIERQKNACDQALSIEEMRFAGFKKTIAILDQNIADAEQALALRRAADEAIVTSHYSEVD